MTDQQQQAQTTDQSSGSSGSSWWKWLLGCGCVGVLLVMCTGVAGVLYSSYAVKSTYDSVQEGVEVRGEVVEQRNEALENTDATVDLEAPLTAEDYESFEATMEAWKNSDSFKQLESLSEQETSDQDQSLVQQVRAMYQLWQAVSSLQKLGTHYVEVVEDHGGIETHYSRMLRIGAVVAAAHEVATDHRFEQTDEPTSDAVATLLYEKRDEVRKKYGSTIDDLASGTHTFEELAQQGELGVYALATLPTESYKPWYDDSVEERKALIESFAWSVAAETLTFGGFAFPVTFDKGLGLGK